MNQINLNFEARLEKKRTQSYNKKNRPSEGKFSFQFSGYNFCSRQLITDN